MSNLIENQQLEQLDLSVKTYNCLRRAGIHTIDSLIEMSEKKLLRKGVLEKLCWQRLFANWNAMDSN